MVKTGYECTSCGMETVQPTKFYNSYSRLYKNKGKMPICKDCVVDVHNEYLNKYKDSKKAIYYMCRVLDAYFDETIYDGAMQQSLEKNGNPARIYFQKINSLKQYDDKTFDDSVKPDFDTDKSEDSKFKFKVNYGGVENSMDITDDIINFWGKGFAKDEYYFLDSEYNEYINAYECDSPVMVNLLKQAAFESLEIRVKREKRDPVDKNLKNLQDLLTSANVKPVQETGANMTDQATFGTLIKRWENELPIPDPLPEWKEKDVFQYVKIWFLGHLTKMIGLDNPFAQDYEDEVAKHTIDTPFDEGGAE